MPESRTQNIPPLPTAKSSAPPTIAVRGPRASATMPPLKEPTHSPTLPQSAMWLRP